jgi:hypothetical protein
LILDCDIINFFFGFFQQSRPVPRFSAVDETGDTVTVSGLLKHFSQFPNAIGIVAEKRVFVCFG